MRDNLAAAIIEITVALHFLIVLLAYEDSKAIMIFNSVSSWIVLFLVGVDNAFYLRKWFRWRKTGGIPLNVRNRQ